MRLAWALLADGVTQRPDGKVDLFGAGLDLIWTRGVPSVHRRLALVGRVILNADEAERAHQLEVVVRAPKGEVIATASGQVQAIPHAVRRLVGAHADMSIGIAVEFVDLELRHFGLYSVGIELDETPVPDPPSFRVVQPTAPLEADE